METRNPIENTSGKSCSNAVRPSENRQGLLADLRPFSPSPPRVAAVAHQPGPSSNIPLTGLTQTYPPMDDSPRPAWPIRQIDATLFGGAHEAQSGQATMASSAESADLLDSIMNRLLSDEYEIFDPQDPNVRATMADYEATILDPGATPPVCPAQEHPPLGQSPGPGRTTGQGSALSSGGAHEALPDQTAMASGGEHAYLFDSMVNRLFSDDYAVYDPQDPNIQVMIADYEATIRDTGAAPSTGPSQGHLPVGDSPGPAITSERMNATPFSGAYEAPSGRTTRASGGERAKRPARPSADPGRTRQKKRARNDYMPLSADQRQALLHIFKKNPQKSNQSLADELGVTIKTIHVLRERFNKTGKLKPGNLANRLTGGQRQALLHIFKTDPKRSNRSLADEFNVTIKTIRVLRERFSKTGELKPGNLANRLTGDQRRIILHLFEADPKRDNQSLADEFGVSIKTIRVLRERFSKTGELKPGDLANRLTGDQRRALLHLFRTDPERDNQSLADEFNVTIKTIRVLRERFSKTGELKPGDLANRLTGDQQRALLHLFKTDPKRGNQSLADEFDVSYSTIQTLRNRFGKTGDIIQRDHANRLTGNQRQAILHVFKADPKRSTQGIVDEFGVSPSTIKMLRNRFNKTGEIKQGDHANRLTDDQRRAILHIFETDPKRSTQSIANEFGVNTRTIQTSRRQFCKTGNIKPKDYTKRLTGDQRRAILHIFETDPKRDNQSIADDFGVVYSTIRILRKRFSQTGNIKRGDHAKRLTDDQRRALLHIFETDPRRTNQSIAEEFDISIKTVQRSRRKFGKT